MRNEWQISGILGGGSEERNFIKSLRKEFSIKN